MKYGSAIAVCATLLLCGCQTTSGRGTLQIANGGSEAILHRGVTLAAGTTARLGFVAETNPDCSQSGTIPTVRVLQQPAHGVLEVQEVRDYPSYTRNNARFACNKVRVAGVRLVYRPQRDFVGRDTFSYEIFVSTGGMIHDIVTASVL